MNSLRLKTFKKLIPLYVILGVGLMGCITELLNETPSEDEIITDIIACVMCAALLIVVSIRIFLGKGQKDVYKQISEGMFGSIPELSNELFENFLATADEIHHVKYNEWYVLGWNEWSTIVMRRSDITRVVISKQWYRYKLIIPVMVDYTLAFYLRDGSIKNIKAKRKKHAYEICDALRIRDVRYNNAME